MKWGGIVFLTLILFSCLSNKSVYLDEENLKPKIDLDSESINDFKQNILISSDNDNCYLIKPQIEKNNFIKLESSIKLSDDEDILLEKPKLEIESYNFNLISDIKIGDGDILYIPSKNTKTNNHITQKKSNQDNIFKKNKKQNNINEKIVNNKEITQNTKTDVLNEKNYQIKNMKIPNDSLQIKKLNDINEEIENKNFDLTNVTNTKVEESNFKEIEGKENDEISILIEKSGWIIKSLMPDIIKLKNREIVKDNTLFTFKTTSSGVVDLVLIRYDENKNTIQRQPYRVKIKPRDLLSDKKQKKQTKDDKNTKKEQKKQEKDDFRKILGNELFVQKKYNEAKGRFQALLDEGKVDGEIFYKMGIIEKELGNQDIGYDFFTKSIKEKDNPFFVPALKEIIKTQKDQKKYQEAVDTFYNYAMDENISEEEKEDLYLLLSEVYYNMKDFVSAANEYRRFVENYPNSINIDKTLFYLANSIENYQLNPDFKESYRLYNIIVEKYPESKYYQLSKNRMLYLERHYLKVN